MSDVTRNMRLIQELDPDAHLVLAADGHWIVRAPSIAIAHGKGVSFLVFCGDTPEDAVANLLRRIQETQDGEEVVTKDRRRWRWNGAAWVAKGLAVVR